MFLLRRALGLPPRRAPEHREEPEQQDFPDDPNTDLGDDETQEVER